jgi:hypothetical protein
VVTGTGCDCAARSDGTSARVRMSVFMEIAGRGGG